MGKFAKLYDFGDDQLLVKTSTNADGYPQVLLITEVDGVEASTGPTFEPKDSSEEAYSIAWDSADKYFNSFDEENANNYYIKLQEAYNKL